MCQAQSRTPVKLSAELRLVEQRFCCAGGELLLVPSCVLGKGVEPSVRPGHVSTLPPAP